MIDNRTLCVFPGHGWTNDHQTFVERSIPAYRVSISNQSQMETYTYDVLAIRLDAADAMLLAREGHVNLTFEVEADAIVSGRVDPIVIKAAAFSDPNFVHKAKILGAHRLMAAAHTEGAILVSARFDVREAFLVVMAKEHQLLPDTGIAQADRADQIRINEELLGSLNPFPPAGAPS